MKKKIYGMLCFIVLLLVFGGSVCAEASDSMPKTPQSTLPRVIDNADVLANMDEMTLNSNIGYIKIMSQFDVVVMTVVSTDGKTIEQYAKDYYVNNGYGIGENKDGIIFIANTQTRELAVSAHGYGAIAFTNAGQKYLLEQIMPYFSEEKYPEAFEEFLDQCELFLKQANTGEPYDTGNLPNDTKDPSKEKGSVGIFGIVVSIITGAFLSFVIMVLMGYRMKSVFRKYEAADYIRPGSLVITERYDNFLDSKIDKTAKPKNNKSSRSGKY